MQAENDHDVRLIPLDPWERDWIYSSARDASRLMATVGGNPSTLPQRLDDLMFKMRTNLAQKQYVDPDLNHGR